MLGVAPPAFLPFAVATHLARSGWAAHRCALHACAIFLPPFLFTAPWVFFTPRPPTCLPHHLRFATTATWCVPRTPGTTARAPFRRVPACRLYRYLPARYHTCYLSRTWVANTHGTHYQHTPAFYLYLISRVVLAPLRTTRFCCWLPALRPFYLLPALHAVTRLPRSTFVLERAPRRPRLPADALPPFRALANTRIFWTRVRSLPPPRNLFSRLRPHLLPTAFTSPALLPSTSLLPLRRGFSDTA